MENGQRTIENETREEGNRVCFSAPGSSDRSICQACGRISKRDEAKYCLDCGKLMRESCQPLDTIRSSHGLQQKHLKFGDTAENETGSLFEESKNSVSDMAWALVVYSSVPYLGILFVPFAFIIGGLGWYKAHRVPKLGGGRLALVCVGLSFLILAVQVFLWWLLYLIPELGAEV